MASPLALHKNIGELVLRLAIMQAMMKFIFISFN